MLQINEWAIVEKIFRSGKQGITGLLKSKKSPCSRIVFKVSQNFDFLVEHEYKIMTILSELEEYCPHFCISPEIIVNPVESKLKQHKNPFDIVTKPIYKFVLLEDFIQGPKLGSYIDSQKSLSVVLSAIKQTMMGIAMSHDLGFTHYDLHTDNIILNRCNKNNVSLYVFDEDHVYTVPTNGYCPKVIDYGFSYADALDGTQLSTSFFHTDIGYTNDRFDWMVDAKLFLISVSYQISNVFVHSNNSKKFKNCIRNMFGELSVDLECGWDDYDGQSILDDLIEELDQGCRIDSFLFKKHTSDSLEIVQAMIDLPLQPMQDDDLIISYNLFLKEFKRIEDKVENTVHLFYILRAIIESARRIKDEYKNKETRCAALTMFKNDIFEVVTSVAKFCTLKDLHYEKMLCSLYSLGNCISGFFYKKMNKRVAHRIREYDSSPIKNMYDILNVLYCNFEDTYTYNADTNISVYDRVKKHTYDFKLTKSEVKTLDRTEYWMKARVLYDIYKDKSKRQMDEANESDASYQSNC
jgi:hypothetical protein